MQEFLLYKNLPHIIVVCEQVDDKPFNRGKLLNAGYNKFKEEFTYLCTHDVDMLPVTEKPDYSEVSCPTQLYGQSKGFGAITLFDKKSFEKLNGFSNRFNGWGREDVELRERCKELNIPVDESRFIERVPIEGLYRVGYSKEPFHFVELPHEVHHKIEKNWEVYEEIKANPDSRDTEGLNNVIEDGIHCYQI